MRNASPESVSSQKATETCLTDKEKGLRSTSASNDDGLLDMVIAFDTTGSMAAYIDDVRHQVTELIPQLFADNKNLRLGIVAFGDYCDMKSRQEFGKAYQCLPPTDEWRKIVRFVKDTQDTSGGDGDEFYELVIKKIVEETPWRPQAEHAMLLIADAMPHELGYSFKDYVVDNAIDWKEEARRASRKGIKIDTVMVEESAEWMKKLSQMTNGVCVPFVSSGNTSRLVEAAVCSRGSVAQRRHAEDLYDVCVDMEMKKVLKSYAKERRSKL